MSDIAKTSVLSLKETAKEWAKKVDVDSVSKLNDRIKAGESLELILVCEDDKHMIEVFKEIVKNKLEMDKIKVYFTTDLKQNSESLEKSLTDFIKNEETGKFVAKNVEFNILE